MKDANSIIVEYAIFAGITVFVIGLLIALKRGIDRDTAEAAEDERRVWRELRRATRELNEATRDFSAAVGDNVAAQQRHCEVLGSASADIKAIEARRRLN